MEHFLDFIGFRFYAVKTLVRHAHPRLRDYEEDCSCGRPLKPLLNFRDRASDAVLSTCVA